MTKLSQVRSSIDDKQPPHESIPGQDLVLRIPKPNLQIIVLGFIAIITLFQTFQLVRISTKASSASTKAVSPAATTAANSEASGTGSNADVPESMVGGC